MYIVYFWLAVISTVNGQETSSNDIENSIDKIISQYYFSFPDSAQFYLDTLGSYAKNHGQWGAYFNIIVNKASIAGAVSDQNHLKVLIDRGDSLLSAQQVIKQQDEGAIMQSNLIYLKGMYYYDRFDFHSAIDQFKAINLLQPKDSLLIFDVNLTIGQAYYNLNDYSEANHYYQLAEVWLPKVSESYAYGRDFAYQKAFIYSLKGRAMVYKGIYDHSDEDISHALQLYYQALNLVDKRFDRASANLRSTLQRRAALAQAELNNYDSVQYYVSKLLKHEKTQEMEQLRAYLLAGTLAVRFKKTKEAEQYLEKAQSLANEQTDEEDVYKGKILKELAQNRLAENKPEEGLKLCQEALKYFTHSTFDISTGNPSFKQINTTSEVLEVLKLKGAAYLFLYKAEHKPVFVESALQNFRLASEYTDKLRNNFLSSESQQFLSGGSKGIYEEGLEAAYLAYLQKKNPKYLNDMFYFMEKNKARGLLEAIQEASAKSTMNIPENIQQQEQTLKGEIAYQKRLLFNNGNDPALRLALDTAYEDYEHFVDKMSKEYPGYYKLRYDTKTIVPDSVKNQLQDGTLLVEYFYGKQFIYVFSMTNQNTHVRRIEKTTGLDTLLSEFIGQIKDKNKPFKSSSNQLYAKLLLPELESPDQKINNLLIVPDGLLGYIPFEALRLKNDSRPHYLLFDYIISYANSATLHFSPATVTKEGKITYAGFAPDYGADKLHGVLKYNKDEVKKGKVYFGGQIFLDDQASEMNFRKLGTQAGLVHLSMHASINDHEPVYSAFYFTDQVAAGTSQSKDLDGTVYLYELYNLSFVAKFAVLSACETGGGKIAGGEGIMSLGRAFQYAGVPSVVMSLWQINDRSSYYITDIFFKNLRAGMPKDSALQQAKISFLSDPKNKYFQHPYYWSAFVLMGDTNAMDTAPEQHLIEITALAILVLLIIIFVGIVSYRQKQKRKKE